MAARFPGDLWCVLRDQQAHPYLLEVCDGYNYEKAEACNLDLFMPSCELPMDPDDFSWWMPIAWPDDPVEIEAEQELLALPKV